MRRKRLKFSYQPGIKEAMMSRTLVTSFLTPAIYVGGTVTFRKLARGMRRIAFDHTRTLRAAAEADLPRNRRIDLHSLYTGAKRKSAH